MKRLIEFPLERGGAMAVEVDEPNTLPITRGGLSSGELAEKAKHTFESALEKIKPAATGIIGQLQTLSHPPSEIMLEFGLKLSGEIGAFIASSATEANFKITLTWEREEPIPRQS